jgi:predicted deacylase
LTEATEGASFIESLALEPGTTSFHSLPVGQTPAGEFSLPLTAIRGANPGPTVSIISGIHACEYIGPVTCLRLAERIDPRELSGTVLIVPVVNLRSLELRVSFVSPLDGKNMFTLFPGNPDGSFSEQVAFAITENLVRGADAFFDLHSGDLFEAIPPHVCYQLSGDADIDRRSEALARLFEIDLLNIMGAGIDEVTGSADENGVSFYGIPSEFMSTGAAPRAGVPSVLLEVGGAGVLDMDLVEMELRGFVNVFRHLGMLEGDVVADIPHTTCYGMYVVTSRYGGFLLPDVAPGDAIEQGQRIGEMRDLRGNVIAEFESPMTGVVLMMFTSPVRISGETLLILAGTDR